MKNSIKVEKLKTLVQSVMVDITATKNATLDELKSLIYSKLFESGGEMIDVWVSKNFEVSLEIHEHLLYKGFVPFQKETEIHFRKSYREFIYGTVVENNNLELSVLVSKTSKQTDIKVGDTIVVSQNKCEIVIID